MKKKGTSSIYKKFECECGNIGLFRDGSILRCYRCQRTYDPTEIIKDFSTVRIPRAMADAMGEFLETEIAIRHGFYTKTSLVSDAVKRFLNEYGDEKTKYLLQQSKS